MEKFRYITGILRPQKAKTPDFFCTKYGTFTLKIRHFQSKKSVLFRLPCQNLYPVRRSWRQKRPENGGKTLQNSSTKRHRKPQNILTKRKSISLNSHRIEKDGRSPLHHKKGISFSQGPLICPPGKRSRPQEASQCTKQHHPHKASRESEKTDDGRSSSWHGHTVSQHIALQKRDMDKTKKRAYARDRGFFRTNTCKTPNECCIFA